MKMLVKMTDREYRDFRRYTSICKGFDPNTTREFTSDFKDQEAEDWLLNTGKIRLIERPKDSRGRSYKDAYLVIHGSEEFCNEVLDGLFTMEIYTEDISRKSKTILRNSKLENRIIREI